MAKGRAWVSKGFMVSSPQISQIEMVNDVLSCEIEVHSVFTYCVTSVLW